LAHTPGQRGQTIEGSAKTDPQHAGRPVIGERSETLEFKIKGSNVIYRRFHYLADPINLVLRHLTEKLQVDMEIFRFTP